MSVCARITVTTGPDRGKVYELTGEMARLGSGPENDVVLSDATVGDHHASIVRREGRFAIFTPVPEGLEVDGTEVPSERWVWLPEAATIRMGRQTSVEFMVDGSENGADNAAAADPAPRPAAPGSSAEPPRRTPGTGSSSAVLPGSRSTTGRTRRSLETAAAGGSVPGAGNPGSDPPARSRRSAAERGEKKGRTIARFITDGPGDPLVRLGEDGHLPELMLHETQAGERADAGPKQQNPVLVIAAVGISLGLTVLMLFMDVGSFGSNAEQKAAARREIVEYYGAEGETLKPYQMHLREARVARSRGDFETERQEYRQVLRLLRSEAKDKLFKYTGLTGRLDYDESSTNRKSDQRLEELIGTLLSE